MENIVLSDEAILLDEAVVIGKRPISRSKTVP